MCRYHQTDKTPFKLISDLVFQWRSLTTAETKRWNSPTGLNKPCRCVITTKRITPCMLQIAQNWGQWRMWPIPKNRGAAPIVRKVAAGVLRDRRPMAAMARLAATARSLHTRVRAGPIIGTATHAKCPVAPRHTAAALKITRCVAAPWPLSWHSLARLKDNDDRQ